MTLNTDVNENIVLTGMMGSGKTAVGKALAKNLGWSFWDTDAYIEKKTGMKIKDIFKRYGEGYFRKLEEALVRQVGRLEKTVISTGGGMPADRKNIRRLRSGGILVWLKVSPAVALARMGKARKRPLLSGGIRESSRIFSALLQKRKPFYEQAHITVNTDKKGVNEVVKEILRRIS